VVVRDLVRGSVTYTFVLTGSLPGLRHTQAFVLNGAGSAISNVLPFGGAVGVAATFVMAAAGATPEKRSPCRRCERCLECGVPAGLAGPRLAMLIVSGEIPDRRLWTAATVTTIMLIGTLAAIVAILTVKGTNPWLAPRGVDWRRCWSGRT
jgi:hypothetical protein